MFSGLFLVGVQHKRKKNNKHILVEQHIEVKEYATNKIFREQERQKRHQNMLRAQSVLQTNKQKFIIYSHTYNSDLFYIYTYR